MEPKVYPLKTGMKVFCWIMAVICLPLVITIPGTVLMIMLAVRGKFVVHQDKCSFTWIRTRELAWSEISKIEWGWHAAGLMGLLMGKPLHYYDKEGKKAAFGIMVESYNDTDAILEAFKTHAGLEPTK